VIAPRIVMGLVLCSAAVIAGSNGTSEECKAPLPFTVVLGVAQDGGAPQAGCRKPCCADRWDDPDRRRLVASLAIVDPESGQRWLIDATPDFPYQLRRLDGVAPPTSNGPPLDGILLTHAHIGHYTGLMHLGREVMGANGFPVFAMPRMLRFLRTNGPWSQLVELGNIELKPLTENTPVRLNERLRVTPIRVPHREEYSEVVGFRVDGPRRSVLWVPDVDKWSRWARPVEELIADVDVAYLDGTFFADGEISGRSMAEVPHPFITESLRRFARLPADERARIRFVHLNHTNPVLELQSPERARVVDAGMKVAEEGETVDL